MKKKKKKESSSSSRDHTDPLFKFAQVYSYCVTKLMFKYFKELVPSALRGMFPTSEDIHSYP